MTPEDRETIKKWAQGAGSPPTLTLAAGKGPRALAMREFVEELSALCPALTLKKDDEPESGPALQLAPNLSFQAVPHSRELPPFLAGLSDGPALAERVPASLAERAKKLSLPALFSIFVQSACPHCPKAVESMMGLALACPDMHLRVIDGELFPDKAAENEVRAAPTTILDGRFRWVGMPDLAELVSVAENRDPAALSAETLIALIADGGAPRIAAMMQEEGKLFPAFYQTLAHDKWPVRLGAMVALEYLAESAPDLAASAGETLKELFGEATNTVRGDLLQSMAYTGRGDLVPWLRETASGDYPEEVREAAAEAAEELDEGD